MNKQPSKVLVAVVILQAGAILGLMGSNLRGPTFESSAHAQIIPDPAGQQMQTNELLRGIDAKLTRISAALDGELKVRVSEPPKK